MECIFLFIGQGQEEKKVRHSTRLKCNERPSYVLTWLTLWFFKSNNGVRNNALVNQLTGWFFVFPDIHVRRISQVCGVAVYSSLGQVCAFEAQSAMSLPPLYCPAFRIWLNTQLFTILGKWHFRRQHLSAILCTPLWRIIFPRCNQCKRHTC